jgi:hypothetical protein
MIRVEYRDGYQNLRYKLEKDGESEKDWSNKDISFLMDVIEALEDDLSAAKEMQDNTEIHGGSE